MSFFFVQAEPTGRPDLNRLGCYIICLAATEVLDRNDSIT